MPCRTRTVIFRLEHEEEENECFDGDKWVVNYEPKEKQPVEEFLKMQGRFAHLFKPDNQHLIAEIQAEVDRRWEDLLTKANA